MNPNIAQDGVGSFSAITRDQTSPRTKPLRERNLFWVAVRGRAPILSASLAVCRTFHAHIVARLGDTLVFEACGDGTDFSRFLAALPVGAVTQASRAGDESLPPLIHDARLQSVRPRPTESVFDHEL